MNKYFGLIISLVAGLSTIIGYFSIYIKGNKNKIISSFLAFSSGVMITLSIIDLLPSSIEYLNEIKNIYISIFYSFILFIIGIILSCIIDKLNKEKEGLYKTGIISMIGIILHNIPEGIATYVLSTIDIKLGILLSIAIILHNIPEGIGIAIPIYYSTKSKKKSLLYTIISGLSEPFGALLSFLFLSKYINITVMGMLYSLIAGLMIYIGYFELFRTSKRYTHNTNNYLLLGSLFILIIEIILKS